MIGALAVLLVLAAGLPTLGQGLPEPAKSSGGFAGSGAGEPAGKVVAVKAQFAAPASGNPGRLFITATIEPGWHIYSITQQSGGPVATRIEPGSVPGVRVLDDFRPTSPPKTSKEPEAFGDLPIETHTGTVTWFAPIELAPDVDPAKLKIDGRLIVQPCNANSCLPPTPIAFTAALGPGVEVPNSPAPAPRPAAAAAPVFDPNALKIAENDQLQQTSMAVAIAMGFLGGLILNLMPCVLPVIGLKLLSFLEQSGHSRRHALVLNVWYSLGLLSVFLVLATLAVTLGLGWGQLFSYNGFNITLAAIVFAMGLSFLGVWEVPIPGFVGRGKTVELAGKEGFAGAFSKGVLTTILATPCSAPFLAPALTWAVSRPAPETYAVFTAVGLGMASPYLLIGAFPGLIAFLPKPGAWMDTFKQIMGFVLLATVVFVLTFLPPALIVPTVGFLFGLWGACWWIGRTPPTVDAAAKVRVWLEAIAFAGAIWILTFNWLAGVMRDRFERSVEEVIASRVRGFEGNGTTEVVPGPMAQPSSEKNLKHLPWQPYTRMMLEEAVAADATVLVDFTADWCLTCKTLEAAVLNTREVRDSVEANRVVTLQADWTHGQPEVTAMLQLLGSKQVPVIAIFPAGNPNEPIVLRGGYTRQTLLDALAKAGPSKQR
jgi:thiol:disulfide interchange protein DsbD